MNRFPPTRPATPATERIPPTLAGRVGVWHRQDGGAWVLLAAVPTVRAALGVIFRHRATGGVACYRVEPAGRTPAAGAAPHVVRDVLG